MLSESHVESCSPFCSSGSSFSSRICRNPTSASSTEKMPHHGVATRYQPVRVWGVTMGSSFGSNKVKVWKHHCKVHLSYQFVEFYHDGRFWDFCQTSSLRSSEKLDWQITGSQVDIKIHWSFGGWPSQVTFVVSPAHIVLRSFETGLFGRVLWYHFFKGSSRDYSLLFPICLWFKSFRIANMFLKFPVVTGQKC